MIATTQAQRLIGHITRDSTAIPVREHFPETPPQKAAKKRIRKSKQGARKGVKPTFVRAKAADRGPRLQPQRHQKLALMLKERPRQCSIGVKKDHHGHERYWRGYK